MALGRKAWLLLAAALAAAPPPAVAQETEPPTLEQIQGWIRDLSSGEESRASPAFSALRKAAPESVGHLGEVILRGSDVEAYWACGILTFAGDAAASAVPAVDRALADRSLQFTGGGARALWLLGAKPKESLPQLERAALLGDIASAALLWRATGAEGNLRRMIEKNAVSKQPIARAEALEVLEGFGTGDRAEYAAGFALAAILDPEPAVRGRALRVLGVSAPSDDRSYAAFLAGLSDESPLVVGGAAFGLGRRGVEGAGIAAALARSAERIGPEVVIGGIAAAAASPQAAQAPLLRVLASGAPADRTGAALLLHGVEPPPAGRAEALAAGIGDPDEQVRRACLMQLRLLGNAAAPAGPALARAVSGADRISAYSANRILQEFREVAAAAMPELVAALASDDARARGTSFSLLAGMGPRPAAVVRGKMSEEEILRRPEAALLLVSADPDLAGRDPRFLAVLTGALRSRDEEVRREGIRLLRACGPRASGAVPALVGLLQSPSFGDRADASRILVDLGAAAVPELAKVLASPDPDAVMTACRTLGSIRRPAAAAAPALLGAITSKIPWVRRAAAEALVQVAPDDPEAKAAITLLLKDEAPDNRACAARLLGMLRRADSAQTLADAAAADRWVRMDSCLALAKLGGAGLPHLVRLAGHEDGDVRMWAIRGISSMGPAAKEAVPVLRKALNDSSSPVREAADRALRGLDPGKEGPEDPALLLGRKVRDLLDRAAILARQDKPAEALDLYLEATRTDPGSAAAWVEIGAIHHRAKRYPEAIEAYAASLLIEPENPSALYGSGLSLYAAARYEEGLRFLRDAARVRPGHSDTLVMMSYCQYSLGKYEDCAVACRDALRLSPEDADAHQRLGLALMALKKPQEAVEPFRSVVRIKPRYANGHYYLAMALRRSGDPGAAVDAARKALEIRPKEADYHAALVGALREAGRAKEAGEALEELRKISPEEAAKLER